MDAFSISAEARAEAELVCSRTSGCRRRQRGTVMKSWTRSCLFASLATWLFLSAAQAQVIPFSGNFGRGLSPSDNQMVFESVARLNATEPSKVGESDSWSNPETRSSGSSTILRVFRSGGMACHLVRHHIVVPGQPLARDYRLTWCRTPSGEWKIKG